MLLTSPEVLQRKGKWILVRNWDLHKERKKGSTLEKEWQKVKIKPFVFLFLIAVIT